MRFETMANDIAALIKELKLERAAIMGFSLGGAVALRTARLAGRGPDTMTFGLSPTTSSAKAGRRSRKPSA